MQCSGQPARKATYEFDLRISTKAFKRTHSAFVLARDATPVKPPCSPLTTQVMKPSYAAYDSTVEEVSAESDSKADGNTVKVNGPVILPKKDTHKTANKTE